jgi:hypothetical protein
MPTSGSLDLIDNHAIVSTPTTHRPASVIDVCRVPLPSVRSAEHKKQTKIQQRLRLAAYWLVFLAEVALLAAGIFCLAKLGQMRETEPEQLRSTTEGAPTQSAVTIDEALQAFGAGR